MRVPEVPFNFVIMLLGAKDSQGKEVFHYFAIREEKLDDFSQALKTGEPYDLKDYGIVVESGFGKPDAKMREKMEKMYGFHHSPAAI